MMGRFQMIAALAMCLAGQAAQARLAAVPGEIFADGFDVDFALVVPAEAGIRQGGIITLEMGVAGSGFSDAGMGLVGPAALSVSATARLYGNGTGALGYSFEAVNATGANLTLYVGRDIAVGDYLLTIKAAASGAVHNAALMLHVLPKGIVHEIWPVDPGGYQNNLDNLAPGDVLVLHQGTWTGSKKVRINGTATAPITIRGYGHGEARPVLEYTGASANHWEIRGSHLIVQGLEFVTPITYPIRIQKPANSSEVDNVSIINNVIRGCGDGCISANNAGVTYRDIRVIDNLFVDAEKTPVYFGNHHGSAPFHNFLFEGNVIDGRSITPGGDIGYGIEVKLNVENAVLRHNYVVGAKGPGIMTYGLDESHNDPALADIIEANIVIGSCQDRNILVGAGAAIVRRNLSIGGYNDGYGLQNYGAWDRLYSVRVHHNTAALNQSRGFWINNGHIAGTGLENLQLTDNLAYPGIGGTGFGFLPLDTATNVIANNTTATPTAAMATALAQLRKQVPSPQDLKPLWPLLDHGPLQPTELAALLDALVALPNQSANNDARACP